jgi:7-keto-8-aminopelargonate synthetase-like enzyme
MFLLQTPPGPVAQIDGREYLYFVGTGYLGLQTHAEVISAACEATRRYGIHSATTRAGFGNIPPTLDAERRIAQFFGTEAAFYFASGYAGNSILLSALADDIDVIFVDQLSHYCVSEAAQQSGRPVYRFRHCDPGDLATGLRKKLRPGQRPLVISDGVFSVRGTIAPVAEYYNVLGGYDGAALLLDDAHAIGVLGAQGRGTYEHAGLWRLVNTLSPLRAPTGGWSREGTGVRASGPGVRVDEPIAPDGPHPNPLPKGEGTEIGPLPKGEGTDVLTFLSGTMSKALGGFGGAIPGSERFIEQVKTGSHWYDGASAPMAAAAAATGRAIELLMADPGLRTRLWSNVRLLKDGLRRIGFEVDQTPVPIVCLIAGAAENMQRIQRELMARGIAVAYMSSYAGLGPEGGLRIAVFATHTEAMIGQLLDELERLG